MGDGCSPAVRLLVEPAWLYDGCRMVLRMVLPSGGVAHCRWPFPEYVPDPDSELLWGTEAWEWMAAWCPFSLARIGDPAAYFARLDARMEAEETSIRRALRNQVATGVDAGWLAERAVRAEWVTLGREVNTPVWSPEWSPTVTAALPALSRRNWDGSTTVLETEDVTFGLREFAGLVLELWTQDPADHHERYLLEWMSPLTMQGVLDRQLSVLYRHLVWDLAAREAPPSVSPRRPLHPTAGLPIASLLGRVHSKLH